MQLHPQAQELANRIAAIFQRGGKSSVDLGSDLIEKVDTLDQEYNQFREQVTTICPKMHEYIQRLEYFQALTDSEKLEINRASIYIFKSCSQWADTYTSGHYNNWRDIKNFRKFGHVAYKWLHDFGFTDCTVKRGANLFINEKAAVLLERLYIPVLTQEELDHFKY